MTDGKFNTRIHKIYDLEDVATAHNVRALRGKARKWLTIRVGSRREKDYG